MCEKTYVFAHFANGNTFRCCDKITVADNLAARAGGNIRGSIYISRRAERPSRVQIDRYTEDTSLADGKSRNPECTDREIKVARSIATRCLLEEISPRARLISSGRVDARRYRARRMGIDYAREEAGGLGTERRDETGAQDWKEDEGWKIRIIETRQRSTEMRSRRDERRKRKRKRKEDAHRGLTHRRTETRNVTNSD